MREDFRRKVTLALKKATEIRRVGDEVAGKGCSEQRDSKGKGLVGSLCPLVCRMALGAAWWGRGVCQEEKRVVMLKNIARPACRGLPLQWGSWPAAW